MAPPGAPRARYGVGAPSDRPRGDVLILTSYGEPAEVWFETASDLIARGYVVWILEPVGQGGSGRYEPVRDLGDAPSIAPDVQAERLLSTDVIRRRPLVVVASGTSASAALLALNAGAPADGLVLSAPQLGPAPAQTLSRARQMQRLSLDLLPAEVRWRWGRNEPDDRALGYTHDATRGRLRLLWQAEDPSLRMGGPSWRWFLTASQAVSDATGVSATHLKLPVLALQPDKGSAPVSDFCRRLSQCTLEPLGPAGSEPELEVDEARHAWLTAVEAFAQQHVDGFPPRSSHARLGAEG